MALTIALMKDAVRAGPVRCILLGVLVGFFAFLSPLIAGGFLLIVAYNYWRAWGTGKWRVLYPDYRFATAFSGRTFGSEVAMGSATLLLRLGSTHEGIYLSTFANQTPPLPPLLVPWADIVTAPHERLAKRTKFVLGRNGVECAVRNSIAENLMANRPDLGTDARVRILSPGD